MTDPKSPCHAHVYYTSAQRESAAELREAFRSDPAFAPLVGYVGRMTDGPVGPHPIAQFEIHFERDAMQRVIAAIEPTGLTALVHPLTDDDLADHTTLARWIGEPLELDLTVLDPPGRNQGISRFGNSDF